MKFTVVILNWNRAEDTIAAVQSVLAQDYASLDVLVWDNASTDSSRQQLEDTFADAPRVRLHFSTSNDGVAGGRNRAFALADTEIIFSLDSDATFADKSAISLLSSRFQQDRNTGVIGCEVIRPDGHLMWPFARESKTWRKREFETIRMDGCAFAVRNDVFKATGGFPEHFSPYGAEDQYFAQRCIGLGYKVAYYPLAVVTHAFSPHGRTPLQFARHVRNSLWIPLELFPFPYAIFQLGKNCDGTSRRSRRRKTMERICTWHH